MRCGAVRGIEIVLEKANKDYEQDKLSLDATEQEESAKSYVCWKLLKDFSVSDELAVVVEREVRQALEDVENVIEEYMTVSAEQQYMHTSLEPEVIPDLKATPASVKQPSVEQRLAHIKHVELGLLQLAEGLSDKAAPTEGRRNRIHTAAEKIMNTLEDQEDCRGYWQLLKENCNKGAAFLATIPRPSEPDVIPLTLTPPAVTPSVTLPLSLTVSSSSSLNMRPESPGGKEEIKEGRSKALPPIPMEDEDFNRAITASLSPSRNAGKEEEKARERKSEKEYKDVAAVSHSSASSSFDSCWWWNPEMNAVPTLVKNKREQKAAGQNNYSDSVMRLFSILSRDANGKKIPTGKNKIAEKRKAEEQLIPVKQEGETPDSDKRAKRQGS